MTVNERHQKKLSDLYGHPLPSKDDKPSVVNLTKIDIPDNVLQILQLGLNTHLKDKFDHNKQKLEVEKLFQQIENLIAAKKISVENQDHLKCDLRRFGYNTYKDFNKDLLTREDYGFLKEFCSNPDIVIRKADKSNVFVLLENNYYNSKLNEMLQDKSKFRPISKDPSDDIKKRLNSIIDEVNQHTNKKTLNKLVGHFQPGYMYGNAKIHKNKTEPPLRPIISTIPTPSYEISKQINTLISKYMPREYSVSSTKAFIDIIRTNDPTNTMASLDVENLFTNVPVSKTIDIILDYVYRNPEIPPPNILEKHLKELL